MTVVFIRLWFCVCVSIPWVLCSPCMSPSLHHLLKGALKIIWNFWILNYRSFLHSCKQGTNSSLELTKSSDLYETSWSLTRFNECLHWSRIWGMVYSASKDNTMVPCCRVPTPFKIIFADVVLHRTRLSHIIWKLNEVSFIGELKSLRGFVTTLFTN